MQTVTCTNTNPHTPRTHTDTPRLLLAKPLLVIRLYKQMQTTCTNELQDYALYIESVNPEMQSSEVETSVKTSISDNLVSTLLLDQGCRENHKTCLVPPAMEHKSALLSIP